MSPGVGAMLRLLAAATNAKSVVEVGTGTGVSGLWLIQGMSDDGILTSVDAEAEHSRLARQSFAQANIPSQRTRLITGRATDVLSRLADGAYDLMVCHGDKREYPTHLTAAMRLLRPRGLVAFTDVLAGDKLPNPSQRDPVTVAVRQLANDMRADDRLASVMLAMGDGLLVAHKHH